MFPASWEPRQAQVFLEIPEFLPDRVARNLFAASVGLHSKFEPSKVSGDQQHRRSLVYYNARAVAPGFDRTVTTCLPYVAYQLGMESFAPRRVELQLTASRDGDYFLPHRDAGRGGKRAGRRITFVYYFFKEPRAFVGGELKFSRGPVYRPQNNAIVFFGSSQGHSVERVTIPHDSFEHARFTLNGWIW
jgi:SM-20-related protein